MKWGMVTKVIFLDFDGVLNNSAFRDAVDDYYESFIDETRMPLLRKIVDKTGAMIVLTTTWRHYWTSDRSKASFTSKKIDSVFEKYGMKIYSKTEAYGEQRDLEVRLFLCKNDVESYVILDDIDFGWSPENYRRFVKTCDTDAGLDEEAVCKTIEILNSEI